MIIINRGRLVAESSLAELTARIGGAVRVRSPELARLSEALQRDGLEHVSRQNGTLFVGDATSDRVGAVAFAAGVPLSELSAESSSLEDVFLELTTEDAR